MNMHTPSQLEMLRRMGVQVWQRRAQVAAEVTAEVTAATVSPVAAAPVVSPEVTTPTVPPMAAEVATPTVAPEVKPPTVSPVTAEVTPAVAPKVTTLQTHADINRAIAACEQCGLHKTRTTTVPGCGNARAEWLFIGEAPGQHEDLQGEPFVGRAGKLLDAMIFALGMTREQVFIANVLKCRPPGNRDPEPREIETCEPYLIRQLELIQPKVIVALGRIAAQALLKTADPLARLRGRIHHYGETNIPLIATYHPAYLLRSPEQKSKVWEDLWMAREVVLR